MISRTPASTTWRGQVHGHEGAGAGAARETRCSGAANLLAHCSGHACHHWRARPQAPLAAAAPLVAAW